MKRTVRMGVFIGAGLALALALAFFVSPQASSQPDGLEKVAADKEIDASATDHALADGPTADYAVTGVDDDALSTGLAGVIGVTVVFAAAGALFFAVRRTGGRDPRGDEAPRAPDHADA